MKGNGKLVANLLILVAGIVLIALHGRDGILPGIIIITGVTFIVPSVLNMVILLSRGTAGGHRGRAALTTGTVASLGGIALGLWMVLFPETLVGLLVYLFGTILLAGGLYHVYMLAFGFRPLKFPLWMYVLPVLLVVAGGLILGGVIPEIESRIVLIAGVAMVVFAANTFLEQAGVRSYAKSRHSIGE